MDVGIHDFHVVGAGDGGGLDVPLALGGDGDLLGLAAVQLERHFLEVQQDMGDVLPHPGKGGELVHDTLDADVGDSRTLDAAEQHPAKAVPDGRGEATLEGIGHELPVGVREGPGGHLSETRPLKITQIQHPAPLLGIQFNDQLLVDIQGDVLAGRDGEDLPLEGGGIQ